jgi:DNA-binding NarL/FixJ family response regulator
MDLTLPRLSGAALFEEIRRIRRDVKVILTSAYDAEAAARLVTQGEHLEFVRRPDRFTDLLFRIEKALAADCAVEAG